MSVDLKRIASVMGGEVVGNRAIFPTPGNSAKDRGSWASIVPSAPDGVLIHSANGGDPLAIKDQLREKGVLPKWEPTSQRPLQRRPRQPGVSYFEFQDADGVTVCRKVRTDKPDGSKVFTWQHRDGKGGWAAGRGCDPLPYRLPDLMAAPRDAVIYVAEGERKADKLAGWGLFATSSKDLPADLSVFSGRTVAILPDNDNQGAKIAGDLLRALEGVAERAFLIELPGLPDKGDIIDWAGTADELRALVEKELNPRAKLLPLLDPAAWHGQETPSREWAWNDYIPHRQATYLTGPGSAGKSLLTQQLCTAIALGLPFMGIDTRQAVAIYVTCEDDADELHRRQKAICAAMGVPLSALSGRLHLVSLAGAPGNELVTFTAEGKMIVGDAYRVLLDTAKATGAGFLALDNVAHLFAGNENIRNQVAGFVSLLNGLALEIDGSVLFLGHPNKAGQDFSGSTAWENQVRSRLFMEVPKDDLGNAHDPDARVLLRGKANYARNGERLTFRWHKWAFILEDELPQDQRAEIAETILANAENEAFLACLRARTAQGDGREVGPSSGPNYAPSQFEGMPQAKGFGRTKLKRAMDRLYQVGKIKSETVMDRKAKREKTIIVEADEASHNAHNAPHNGSTTQVHNTAQRPHNMGSAHTYIINNMGAASQPPAPIHEKEDGPDLSRVIFTDDDDGIGEDGNIIGWDQ
jgi:RecA-family ATPase